MQRVRRTKSQPRIGVMRPRSLRLPVCAGPVPPDRAHARIDDPLDVRLEPHRAHERKRRRPFRGKDRGEPTRGAKKRVSLRDEVIDQRDTFTDQGELGYLDRLEVCLSVGSIRRSLKRRLRNRDAPHQTRQDFTAKSCRNEPFGNPPWSPEPPSISSALPGVGTRITSGPRTALKPVSSKFFTSPLMARRSVRSRPDLTSSRTFRDIFDIPEVPRGE